MAVIYSAKWVAILAGLLLLPASARAADLPQPIGPFFSIKPPPVPSEQWCRNLGIRIVTVKSDTQVQEWCDPKNNDLLLADVFGKLANGNPGANKGANVDYPCAGSTSLGLPVPPSSVRSGLCAHP